MSQDPTSLADFSGTARLFPLPNLVLFPYVIQPLHVFEPRYRQMMDDALAGDRLLAMALLRAGWEEDYHQSPPLHPVVCLGKIFKEERLADGRYNFLLHGLCRARILEELKTGKPYRSARVELLRDVPPGAAEGEQDLRRQLGQRLGKWFAAHSLALEQLRQVLQSNLPLGTLCDVFTFALALDVEVKQQLLGEVDVGRRARLLLDRLQTAEAPAAPASPPRKFPPGFSSN
jgi:Lon protease-like protein